MTIVIRRTVKMERSAPPQQMPDAPSRLSVPTSPIRSYDFGETAVFRAWEALSDEVFDTWEREHQGSDEL